MSGRTFMDYFHNTIQAHRIFGPAMQLQMPTAKNAQEWIERIENDLSPENLSCDGELRGWQLSAKRRDLQDALRYCQNLLDPDREANDGNKFMQFAKQFSPMPDEGAKDGFAMMRQFMVPRQSRGYRNMFNSARRERTRSREIALNTAVNEGFKTGARVVLSNGVRGTIVKINRTRVVVNGEDQRKWSVPPRCMELLKVK